MPARRPHHHPQNSREQWRNSLKQTQAALDTIYTPYTIEYYSPTEFITKKRERHALIASFPASRKIKIDKPTHALGSKVNIDTINLESNLGNNLEQYLVNLKVRAALSIQNDESSSRSDEIDEWFSTFSENLKYLMEDNSAHLKFDSDHLTFKIGQEGKADYTFQTLSSGYLAIFDIYADLLVKSAYLEIPPNKLTGVVLIDEVDVHLHVSLQRKILPFFSRSFPDVQFIVSTHSPFVVTSTSDTLVYDLSSGRESDNLSMYSIEAVVEGLLGVPPISEELETIIKHLAKVTADESFDPISAEATLQKISPYVDTLDAESRMFYEIAVNKLIKHRASGV